MSYPDYQYPSPGPGYESYSQQYDPQPYTITDPHASYGHYDYTPSQSLDQYAQPAASVLTDYSGYNSIADTGYTPPSVTSYPDSSSSYHDSSSGYTPYPYSQDSIKTDQPKSSYSTPIDSISGSYSAPAPNYSSGTPTQEPAISQPVSDYSSYQYQPPSYNQISSTYGQESTPSSYTGSYNQDSSGYSYQEEPSQPSSTWTAPDQYTSYSAGYYEDTASGTNYHQKAESGFGTTDFSSSLDKYSQVSSSVTTGGGGYSQPEIYSGTDDHSSGFSYLGYVKPISNQDFKPQNDFGGYSGPARFNKGPENVNRVGGRSYSNEKGSSFSVGSSSSNTSYYSGGGGGRGSGRGGFRGGNKDNFVNRGGSTRYSAGQSSSFSTQTAATQRSFNNQNSGGVSSFGGHGFSNRGSRDGVSSRGSFSSANRSDQHSNASKPALGTFDARNKINEARSAGTASSKVTTNTVPAIKNKVPVSTFKTPEPIKKEIFKAPARPQDRLLNEIEEKEKAQRAEELKKSEEEKKKAEEKRLKDFEEEKKKAEEELRKKVAEDAVKAAPPTKPPETAEEIAHEEEIQRKIRNSVVIISPEQEIALLKDDPSQDIEMPEELRKLLKTLTTDYLCKMCSVRIVGPQMAAMHYNGKNHLKKLRNFVQTNGRSAGFNLETLDDSEKDKQKEEAGEKKTEVVEITGIDEKRYCKICKVSFSQESQAEMHYKGKNHAKKMKSIGTGPEVFECKICSVTVTAQEHLTAHINGARHKLQVRKLDTNENYRGGPRGRGRAFGFRGQGRGAGFRGQGRGGRGVGSVGEADWRPLPNAGARGRGFRGRGRGGDDFLWRGPGFKRREVFDDGLPYRGDFGPPFPKRPRF